MRMTVMMIAVTRRGTAHEIAWGMLLLVLCLVGIESYGGLMEWRFRLRAVPTEAVVDHATVTPEWTVAFQWNGELHTAHTYRLSGSPLAGDRIEILVDPDDPSIVTSPDMTLDDWSDLPGFIAACVTAVLIAVLILWWIRLPGDSPRAPRLLRPRGAPNRRPRSGGSRPVRRRNNRRRR
jgi:hypothetical protein